MTGTGLFKKTIIKHEFAKAQRRISLKSCGEGQEECSMFSLSVQ
jgi:hypothetical protein